MRSAVPQRDQEKMYSLSLSLSGIMIGGGCHSHLLNGGSRRVALHVHLAYISIGFCLKRNQSEITTRLSQQST